VKRAFILPIRSLDGMLGRKARRSLGVTPQDLAAAQSRSEQDDVSVLGVRFTNDVMCPRARFDYLEDLFGERFQRIDIDSSLFNKHKIPLRAHSTLTVDFVNKPDHPTRKAYDQVVAFMHKQIGA